jgi:hypothetical protein
MAGYPRVIGRGGPPQQYYPGFGSAPAPYAAQGPDVDGYVAGYVAGMRAVGIEPPGPPGGMHNMRVHPHPAPAVHSAPWRGMIAPGVSPVQEGHVPLPLNAETDGGQWGNGGAGTGGLIIFSARPQKPFKTARLIVRGTKVGATAVGNLVGEIFVGTDLQQGELGNIDLESIGAATAFDTWLSLKQAEPGVWIRVQATLTAFPSGTDFEVYTISALGHYLH